MRSKGTRWIFPLAIAVYMVAAWFSTGFQNADEHYQVITFAQWKVGAPNMDPLPWEFDERIRSSILPWIAAGVFKAASIFSVKGPFILTFLLRLITAMLALFTVRHFVKAAEVQLDGSLRKPFSLISHFLWFLPFLLVRFSSETWALLCLLHALAAVYRIESDKRWPWLAGAWLAVMTCLKPSMLPAAAGVVLWVLVMRRPKIVHVIRAVVAALVVFLVSWALDSWFYRTSTFSLGNYLHANFPSHPGHVFDAFPWWYYAAWVFKYAMFPIGPLILIGFWLLIRYHARSVLLWCLLPMVIALSIVPHKELRFLFPLAGLVPLLLMMAYGSAKDRWVSFTAWRSLRKPILAVPALVNLAALAVVISSPAGDGRTRLANALGDRYDAHPMRVEYLANEKDIWDIRIPRFYLPPGATDTIVKDACTVSPSPSSTRILLIANQVLGPCPDPQGPQWIKIMNALPWWKEKALLLYEWEDAGPVWTLYEKRP